MPIYAPDGCKVLYIMTEYAFHFLGALNKSFLSFLDFDEDKSLELIYHLYPLYDGNLSMLTQLTKLLAILDTIEFQQLCFFNRFVRRAP